MAVERTLSGQYDAVNPQETIPSLRLKVQSAAGAVQTLEFSGVPQAEAVRRAVARGFVVLTLESANAAPGVSSGRASFPLLLFSQELLALLDAGLNLTEALATLLTKERHGFARSVLEQILQALHEGRNFSDVLAMQPRHFPAVYVAMVRAAERTGDLPQALSRYITYQIQFETLRKKLVSAAIYPVMLLSVGGLVTLFLLGYVVPRFAVVYESSGRELPWLSAMLLAFGKFVYIHWQIALSGLVAGIALIVWGLSQPGYRTWLLDQTLRLPFFAVQANAFRLSRFYRAVSLLLSAGIALPRALEMVSGLLGAKQQALLILSRVAVEQGQPLSTALVAHDLATPVAESLIKVGERSGQMAQMLERTARFADEEFSRWIDWATRLMEPILMTVIGMVIGTVVVLMYLPIFELAGSLQ
jgi:general secretion pathway protein F